jgi:methylenetetrahydrofolate reductase (NADPH)
MKRTVSGLQEMLGAGKPVILAEIKPPHGADPGAIRTQVKSYAGRVSALGISDNRDEIRVSALAAAALAVAEGVEPILHVTTRDRNRIGLVSDCLGAAALGIRNILCTGGTHQMLGKFTNAKGVYDVDPVQLMQMIAGGSSGIQACIGGVANPYADPVELQLMLIEKKISVGVDFLVTQSVFDFERFSAWWKRITEAGLEKKTAFIAGVRVLCSADEARGCAEERPSPAIPAGVVERLDAKKGKASQRDEGVKMALETVERLSSLKGLAGFEITCDCDDEAALETITRMKNA